MTTPPQLSIIVPLLNEKETLPPLFATLSLQLDISFEAIFVDGGSQDDSSDLLCTLSNNAPFSCYPLSAERGRVRQLNAGASVARGEYLLFLHADSRFEDPYALTKGVLALKDAMASRGHSRIAARFPLRFDLPPDRYGFGYYFYESKARLDRPGSIHGDQGFLLPRLFYESVGPFDEILPILEDDRFADRVRQKGEWILLPSEIFTSSRRFETEGLNERQTLNALLMNFAAVGWHGFFKNAVDIYRNQNCTGRLNLLPYFNVIRELLRKEPFANRSTLWYSTGRYVRSNAWQLLFAFEMRRRFLKGLPLLRDEPSSLTAFESLFERLTGHPLGNLTAAILVRFWFAVKFIHLRCHNSTR